jgi:hypothetical protein
MSTNAETKLRSIVGVRTGISVHRFPENIGSLSTDPESRKFCLFRFHNVDDSGNSGSTTVCVVLPFPEINDAINVKYDNVEFDVVGAIAVGAAGGNVSVDRLSAIAKTGIHSFNKDSFARIAADVVLGGTPGLKAGVAKGLNTIQNPYITNVFNGVGFREFSFSFVLIPKGAHESDHIQNIIETFKKTMLPEKKLIKEGKHRQQSTGILKMPDKVDITFFPTTKDYKRNDSVIKIQNAVVTDFTVEYSAGTQNPTFFKETGAPLSATLNVSVKETEIYTKERLVRDYPKFKEEFK